MPPVAAVDRQDPLCPEYICRQVFEKRLETLCENALPAANETVSNAVGSEMVVTAVVAVVVEPRVSMRYPGSEDQRQRHFGMSRTDDPHGVSATAARILCSTASTRPLPTRSHLFNTTRSA